MASNRIKFYDDKNPNPGPDCGPNILDKFLKFIKPPRWINPGEPYPIDPRTKNKLDQDVINPAANTAATGKLGVDTKSDITVMR